MEASAITAQSRQPDSPAVLQPRRIPLGVIATVLATAEAILFGRKPRRAMLLIELGIMF